MRFAELSAPALWGVWLTWTSLALFIVMGLDKLQAKRGAWRVPEKQLFLLAALGGAPGGVLAMHLFRHKTRHRSFTLGFPALAVLHLALLFYLFLR